MYCLYKSVVTLLIPTQLSLQKNEELKSEISHLKGELTNSIEKKQTERRQDFVRNGSK